MATKRLQHMYYKMPDGKYYMFQPGQQITDSQGNIYMYNQFTGTIGPVSQFDNSLGDTQQGGPTGESILSGDNIKPVDLNNSNANLSDRFPILFGNSKKETTQSTVNLSDKLPVLFGNDTKETSQSTDTGGTTTTNVGGSNPKPTPRTYKKWVSKPAEPTYTAPDGTTHTGMTQDQFNQRMKEYEMENQIYQNNKATGNVKGINGIDREKIYTEAVAKYAANPSSFNQQQRDALIRVGEQLGITPEQTAANILNGGNKQNVVLQQAPTPTPTPTPTVQPTVTPSNNDVSNYGGRYGDQNEGNDYTRRTQGANNSARFDLIL